MKRRGAADAATSAADYVRVEVRSGEWTDVVELTAAAGTKLLVDRETDQETATTGGAEFGALQARLITVSGTTQFTVRHPPTTTIRHTVSLPKPEPADALQDFSAALLAAKDGQHISRAGWANSGRFVTAQAGYPDGIPINDNTADATGLPAGTTCEFLPYLMMCLNWVTAQEVHDYGGEPHGTHLAWAAAARRPRFVPWTPSMDDLMADDWLVNPRGPRPR